MPQLGKGMHTGWHDGDAVFIRFDLCRYSDTHSPILCYKWRASRLLSVYCSLRRFRSRHFEKRSRGFDESCASGSGHPPFGSGHSLTFLQETTIDQKVRSHLHWFTVTQVHSGGDRCNPPQPQTIGHGIVKYGRQDATMYDTIITLMLWLWNKFGVRHVSIEVECEMKPYAIVVAAHKAALFLVEVHRFSSSGRAHAVLLWTKL
jgi:hypothetical protein